MILFNWHPPRWVIYAAIAIGVILLAMFLSRTFTSDMLRFNRQHQQQIEDVVEQKEDITDSLTKIIKTERQVNEHVVESIQKKVDVVKKNATQERNLIFYKYEKALSLVDSLSDDSINLVYQRCHSRYDTLFR